MRAVPLASQRGSRGVCAAGREGPAPQSPQAAGQRLVPTSGHAAARCLCRLLWGRSMSTPSEAGACCRSPCRPWRLR